MFSQKQNSWVHTSGSANMLLNPQGSFVVRTCFLGCVWLGIPSASMPAVQPEVAGDYDRVILGEQSGYVTGLFSDCTGECKFSCQFFFEGKRRGDRFAIVASEPGTNGLIRGEAKLVGKKLWLKLAESPGGCWNVEPEIHKSGTDVLLNSAAPWLQIRLAKNNIAVFDKPGGQTKWHLQLNAAVIVLRHDSTWLYIRLPGGDTRTGWVKTADLQPLRKRTK